MNEALKNTFMYILIQNNFLSKMFERHDMSLKSMVQIHKTFKEDL
jgi:hypothetical protein